MILRIDYAFNCFRIAPHHRMQICMCALCAAASPPHTAVNEFTYLGHIHTSAPYQRHSHVCDDEPSVFQDHSN